MEHDTRIASVVTQLASVQGTQAIVLGGSHASDTALPDSDIDIAIYYSEAQPLDINHVRSIASTFNDTANPVVTGLGEWGRWVNGGAWLTVEGQRVDFLYRSIDFVSRILDDCTRGIFEVDYLQQPPYGFYSYMYCAETQICRPLYDPNDILSRLKVKVANYPQALKQAIIEPNLWSARFSVENGEKAAKRSDIYFTAGCITRAISMLVQVLYALNEKYFLSEKNLVKQVSSFKLLPDNFVERITATLGNVGSDTDELMQAIRSTYSLLRDLEALC